MIRSTLICALAVFALAANNAIVTADVFDGVTEGNSSIFITDRQATHPNFVDWFSNNVVGDSSNFVDLELEITGPDLTRADLILNPLPYPFDPNTPGNSEFSSITTLTNMSSESWHTYTLLIGTGYYNDFTDVDTFVPYVGTNTSLTNFDYPDLDSTFDSDIFTQVAVSAHSITWSGGVVDPGETVEVRFSFDIPENQPITTFRSSFTSMPEPGGGSLVLIGLFALIKRRRKPMHVAA